MITSKILCKNQDENILWDVLHEETTKTKRRASGPFLLTETSSRRLKKLSSATRPASGLLLALELEIGSRPDRSPRL